MKRVHAEVSGPARQEALALQQLLTNSLQNAGMSTCTIIIQIISLLTNIPSIFIMKYRVLFLAFVKLSEIKTPAEAFLASWQIQEH